jgi:amidohydrolase
MTEPQTEIDFLAEAHRLFSYTQKLRRDFHLHPELGFQEFRTASIIARELSQLGLEVRTGVAETGVVALLEGSKPGPVVLVRFDMDALPIQEASGAPYASLNPGIMHACGHDGHVAIGLTVAHLLNEHRDELHGTVKFVFQPAEEGMGGAERMIQEGILQNPRPDAALGLHIWNELPLGQLGISAGANMAAADIFHVRILGRGGHGAIPDQAVDPVASTAQIITALQTIVSRNVSPLQSAVLSVTNLRAGEAYNVIPASAELRGTLRTFDSALRKKILERFHQIVRSIAQAMGCQAEIEIEQLTPALINAPQIAAQVQQAAARLLPGSRIAPLYATMGSEDMACILQEIPGCYFFVGSANIEKGLDAGHHHPRFDFDEEVLPRAAALMAASAARLLKQAYPPASD